MVADKNRFWFFFRKNTNQSNYKEAINFDWIWPASCTGNFSTFAGPLVYVSYVYCFQLIRIWFAIYMTHVCIWSQYSPLMKGLIWKDNIAYVSLILQTLSSFYIEYVGASLQIQRILVTPIWKCLIVHAFTI